jgi:hypothetical protein
MVDVQTVSIVIASSGVMVAAIYYVLQLGHQNKMRQTDLLMRLYSAWGSEDLQKAGYRVLELQIEDYNDYVKKYGSKTWYTRQFSIVQSWLVLQRNRFSSA